MSQIVSQPLNVAIIGCGNISAAYIELSRLFRNIRIVACADADPAAAKRRAEEFGLHAHSVEDLLAAPDVDIVVNLTIPAAHYDVSRSIIEAGKHVYSEKPFTLSVAQGRDLIERAAQKGVRIGSAPDTFLGGTHQHARHLIDSGAVGRIIAGTGHCMSHGMEDWHPNPDFFFKPGAGPVFDLGPYYITNLVQLIGPVKRIMALSSIPFPQRTITSQPRAGEKIVVETPTTVHALLEFKHGAQVTLGASWDVWHHGHSPMELYGEKATLYLPDPNFFGGDLKICKADNHGEKTPLYSHPLDVPNQDQGDGLKANYRTAGLADMARAIQDNAPHRASAELALHVVDVMSSILEAGETGKPVVLSTTCDRPEALNPEQAESLLFDKGENS